MSLTLTDVWTKNYDQDSMNGPIVKCSKVIGPHKMVIAVASLSSFGGHQVGAAAAVGFTQIVEGGQIINYPVQQGEVKGENITELHWDLSVIQSHARASVSILMFD
jgi:hypothetical protein